MKKNYMVVVALENSKYMRHYFELFAEAKKFFMECDCITATLHHYNNSTKNFERMARR